MNPGAFSQRWHLTPKGFFLVPEFAKPQPEDPIDAIRRCYGDDPTHSVLPDEEHGIYAEGWLALLRFVKGLEATYRSRFESIDRMNAMFPDPATPHPGGHRCDLPSGGDLAFRCPVCGLEWHRSRFWGGDYSVWMPR